MFVLRHVRGLVVSSAPEKWKCPDTTATQHVLTPHRQSIAPIHLLKSNKSVPNSEKTVCSALLTGSFVLRCNREKLIHLPPLRVVEKRVWSVDN